jgi:hypothetical protein
MLSIRAVCVHFIYMKHIQLECPGKRKQTQNIPTFLFTCSMVGMFYKKEVLSVLLWRSILAKSPLSW